MTEFRYIVLTKCPNLSPDHNTDYNSQTETTRKYDNQTQKKKKKEAGYLKKARQRTNPRKENTTQKHVSRTKENSPQLPFLL